MSSYPGRYVNKSAWQRPQHWMKGCYGCSRKGFSILRPYTLPGWASLYSSQLWTFPCPLWGSLTLNYSGSSHPHSLSCQTAESVTCEDMDAIP